MRKKCGEREAFGELVGPELGLFGLFGGWGAIVIKIDASIVGGGGKGFIERYNASVAFDGRGLLGVGLVLGVEERHGYRG